MKSIYYYLMISGFLLFSCNSDIKNGGELLEFPVDKEESASLPLSEITETITAIELELTDESLINPDYIQRIILSDNHVIIAQDDNVLVFSRSGKFTCSIGSKGQGPGEYTSIRNMAIDETGKRLFVNSNKKIICYDLQGNVLMESSLFQLNDRISIIDINYINNELLLIVYSMGREDENGLFNHSAVYRLNDELQIIDSCTIRKIYEIQHFSSSRSEDFILISDSTVYLYYPYNSIITPELRAYGIQNPAKAALRDTLYRFENNCLIPELKLKFNKNGMDGEGNMFINLLNVRRSSRYIFAEYYNHSLDYDYYYPYFCFCYDTKTGKGYNMRDGYIDDIHQIEERIRKIRPFNTNSELFYYWHTNMKPDDLEEPNPTLYIGKLKK